MIEYKLIIYILLYLNFISFILGYLYCKIKHTSCIENSSNVSYNTKINKKELG